MTNPHLRIARKDALPVALLGATVALGAGVSWTETSMGLRFLMIVFVCTSCWHLRQVYWKAIIPDNDAIVVRDRFRRERRLPYTAVEQVAYYPTNSFRIFLEEGQSVGFDPNTAGIDAFASALVARVRAVRTVLVTGEIRETA